MPDEIPFNASGWSERDRLTRLEVLQQTESRRIDNVERLLTAIDSKLDQILDSNAKRAGGSALLGTIVKPIGGVAWGLILAGVGWAISQYVRVTGAH